MRLKRIPADATLGPPAKLPHARGRVRHEPGRMNKTEAAYGSYLEARRACGEIASWWYEPWKFRLADRTYYTLDFLVMLPDGLLEIHEVKGWMEDDAAVKLKVCAVQFPMFRFVLVKHIKGAGWIEREVSA